MRKASIAKGKDARRKSTVVSTEKGKKAGNLQKKGKFLSGWQTRYFIAQGSYLRSGGFDLCI
jgi:hypothetical protein